MAAQTYYSGAPMAPTTVSPHQQPSNMYPQQPPTSDPYHHGHSDMNSHAPPPYQEQRPGVHFAPTPTELPQRHSFSGQSRPPPHVLDQPPMQYNNQYVPQNNTMVHRPSQSYGSPPSGNGYGPPPQRPQFLSPHMRPYANPNSSQYSLDHGYSSDPEPDRRRHSHRKRRDSGESRSVKSGSSRSSNADAFLGAAGGGLIGDLIFPGLGTVGGAALGWLGGKDYGGHRKGREDKRRKAQDEWEAKYKPHHRDRSRGSSRGSSAYLAEKDDRHGYERRHSHY